MHKIYWRQYNTWKYKRCFVLPTTKSFLIGNKMYSFFSASSSRLFCAFWHCFMIAGHNNSLTATLTIMTLNKRKGVISVSLQFFYIILILAHAHILEKLHHNKYKKNKIQHSFLLFVVLWYSVTFFTNLNDFFINTYLTVLKGLLP